MAEHTLKDVVGEPYGPWDPPPGETFCEHLQRLVDALAKLRVARVGGMFDPWIHCDLCAVAVQLTYAGVYAYQRRRPLTPDVIWHKVHPPAKANQIVAFRECLWRRAA